MSNRYLNKHFTTLSLGGGDARTTLYAGGNTILEDVTITNRLVIGKTFYQSENDDNQETLEVVGNTHISGNVTIGESTNVVHDDLNMASNLNVNGDINVEGILTAPNFNHGLPLGELSKCHGCEAASYGLQWNVDHETIDVTGQQQNSTEDRQLCLNCIYQVVMFGVAQQNNHDRINL